MRLLVVIIARTAVADTLASYSKYTVKENARAIDAIAVKHDIWLEDDQFEGMDTCIERQAA